MYSLSKTFVGRWVYIENKNLGYRVHERKRQKFPLLEYKHDI